MSLLTKMSTLLTILLLLQPCLSMTSTGRSGHGLIGYGIKMYHPICPFSCRAVISSSTLNCSSTMDMSMSGMMMDMAETSTDCYATDPTFLETMAWCVRQRCTNLEAWEIERYWYRNIPGIDKVQPAPRWTFQETLERIESPPTEVLVSGVPLNVTSLVADEDYWEQYHTLSTFEKVESNHETYGIILLVSGAGIPIATSLLRFLPFPSLLASKFSALLIDPPLFGHRHKTPYLNLAVMPTRGQTLMITYLVLINIILSAVGYHSAQPNGWYENRYNEVLTYVSNRVGVLSFANVPLLVLYAGRNNVLYWVTNWSRSTFLLLHRWAAYICTVQAALHSAIYLHLYLQSGEYGSESQLAYWIWGIIATLGMCLLLPASIIPIRAKMYELFLASHFVLAFLAVLGCYLHIYYRFVHQWGYEVWIYTAFAVWGFDRFLRLLRLARNGSQKAHITIIDEDYVKVHLPGMTGNGHAYLYFPTLTWRVWENHPFSITTSAVQKQVEETSSMSDEEKSGARVAMTRTTTMEPSIGLTFFVRTRTGVTAMLRAHQQLSVLVESDYLPHADLSRYKTLICIAGGVGITAVLPLLRSHPGRAKLYWSSRSAELVAALDSMLESVEKEVVVGRRLDLAALIRDEAANGSGEMAVVVSGPAGMADDVRSIVTGIAGKTKRPIKLIEESFSW